MSAFNKFNQFVQDLANGKHNLGADTLKVMLTNTAPVATNAIKADITDIAAGSGYTAGGSAAAVTSSTQTGGVEKVIPTGSVVFTSSGSIGPFRYAVLYNDTQAAPAKPLIGWWDFGSPVTLTTGNTFTVQLDGTNGILQVS